MNYTEKTNISNYHKVCNSCFFTENFPGVTIEENGRCNYCNSGEFFTKKRKLTSSDIKQLSLVASQLKEEREKKGAKYDCIIGASGGLDSSYVLYVAKRIMELNPLVVNYVNDFTTSIAKDNLQKICKELKVDLKIIKSKKKLDKKHIKSFIHAFKDVGSYWGCCAFCGYILDEVVYKYAREENISTMLCSNNLYENMSTQYLTEKFKINFMLRNIYNLKLRKLLKFLYHLSISQYYFNRFRMEFYISSRMKTIFNRSTLCSLIPSKSSKILKNMKRVSITKYVPWDIDNIVKTMKKE